MGVSFVRTLIVFMLLIVSLRIMGKRQLGELEPTELAVAVLISNLASQPLQDPGIPLLYGIVPVLTLLASQVLASAVAFRSSSVRRVLFGKPSIVIDNGRIVQSELRRNRLSLDELFTELRSSGVTDISTVRHAILETNGTLSVLLYASSSPVTAKDLGVTVNDPGLPVTVISDGCVLSENLALLNKDGEWLSAELGKRGISGPRDVFLMTVGSDGAVTVIKKERGI